MTRGLRKGSSHSLSVSASIKAEAVIGNIGSYEPHERLDPTVIGDAVNLASRLEALTRNYGVDILAWTERGPICAR